MFKNYLKVGLRNLWNHKFFSFINIFGLALGMACCLLILVHVRNELTYDQHFDRSEDIYRLAMNADIQGEAIQYPLVGYPWADFLSQEVPQVERAVRFFTPQSANFRIGEQRFEEKKFAFADSSLFDVFSLPLLSGDPAEALVAPNSIILSRSIAEAYFGSPDALGKIMKLDFNGQEIDLQVTGVYEDIPRGTHFHFGSIASMATMVNQFGEDNPFLNNPGVNATYTYLVTEQPEMVEQQLGVLYESKTPEANRQFFRGSFLQPLEDIHLGSNLIAEIEPNGNATYVYIFIFVAVLTLLIACINFINLSTARSTNRSKEVGLRKTVGALRGHLVGQFLGEAIIISLIALSLAILIAELSSGWISRTTGIWLDIHYIQDAFVIGLLLLITLAVGLGAGLYPAFFLSRFQPVQVLRGPVKGGKKGGNLRKSLVVFQFIISTGLIIGSGVLLRQLDYIQGMDMGFDREWRVVMPVQVNPPPKRVQMVERLKREFDAYPGIVNTSASFTVPGQARNLTQVVVDGQSREEPYMPVTLGIDYNYVETMGLRIKEGRPFSTEYAADSFETVLVNEALLRELQIEDPLGKILIYPANPGFGQQEEDRVRIIGVYEDMHFEPVYREIHPMILRIIPQQYNNLFVHISPENKDQTLAYMESSWNDIVAEKPFSYRFLDEELSEIYASEHELGSLVNIFTLVAVFIACLGLFGLSAFTTQQRRKEISIRKVLGASSRDIMFLLTREFLVLVAIAIIPGALLAWYVTEVYWLETFAYKTTLGIGIFLLAGGLSLLIAFLTVSFLSFRAANANPVDALHRE